MSLGTFGDYITEEDELPLFSPVGGYADGGMSGPSLLSSAMPDAPDPLFSPVTSATYEPEGTFATETFDTDYAGDPYSKFLADQIKNSTEISNGYSDELAGISDRQQKLTNSAENDWSSLGAALVGGLGAVAAGGTFGEVAGGAAAVGTTHYNNLEAQEQTKQALLTKDADRIFSEMKLEQGRTGQLRVGEAQHAARMNMAQAQGKVIGTEQNEQARQGKVDDRKEIDSNKPVDPLNEWKEKKIKAEIEKPVRQAVDQYPSTIKAMPNAKPGDYLKNYTGTAMAKVETGYLTYLEGVKMVMPIAEKGSNLGSQYKLSADETNALRVGQSKMADGRRQMAEVGQAITDSEWSKGIAPYLHTVGVTDVTDPFYSFVQSLDKVIVKTDGVTRLKQLQDEMEKSRANFYLTRNGVVDQFDYSRLGKESLGSLNPEQLTAQSFGGKTLREQMNTPEWFGDSAFGSNAVPVPSYTPPAGNSKFSEQDLQRKMEEIKARAKKP